MFVISEAKKSSYHYEFIAAYFKPCFTLDCFLNRDDIQVFTAEYQGNLIGVSLVSFTEHSPLGRKKCHFLYTLIDEKYRKRGLNTQLKATAESKCIEEGGRFATAHLRLTNIASLNSLKKCGYSLDASYESHYDNGDQKILMIKDLEPARS